MRQDLFGRWLKINFTDFMRLRHGLSGLLWYAWTAAAVHATESPAWTHLPSRTEDQPGFTYHPSPSDWRELPIYQVITDRFFDGDPANNQVGTDSIYNPLSMDARHGGDLAGLQQHLDYITNLGFRAIWISPVYLNHHGAYHGYHILDFNRIDPHWGSLDDLRAMVDEAHRQGLYVIIDVVFNHMARLLASEAPGYPRFSEEPYPLQWGLPEQRYAPPFDDLSLFHGHGSIGDWENERQNVLGDLQGLADLRTEDPRVRRWLAESHLALIAATDCDGFRVDTAHHVELSFWQEVLPRIKEGAAALGKTNFFIFAEALRGKDQDVSVLVREGSFPSALYYPYYFTLIDLWGKRGPTRDVTDRWSRLPEYGPAAEHQLVSFIDNHDRARMLNESYLAGDTNRAMAALTMLYASPAIPCVYYGTEQGFSGSKGHRAREAMFDAGPPPYPLHFDASHPLFQHIRRLNHLRAAYPALVRGTLEVRHDEPGAGILAFTRTEQEEVVLAVVNNSQTSRTYEVEGAWVDALTGEAYDQRIPPDTTRILVAPDRYQPVAEAVIEPSSNPSRRVSTSQLFVPDGFLDASAQLVASNNLVTLHAAFDPATRLAYLAVPAAPRGYDRFILIARSNTTGTTVAPWQKEGQVPAYDLLVSDEGDSDYTSLRGTRLRHWSISHDRNVLEAVLEWPADWGPRMHVRTALYGTEDRGHEVDGQRLPAEGMLEIDLERLPAPR